MTDLLTRLRTGYAGRLTVTHEAAAEIEHLAKSMDDLQRRLDNLEIDRSHEFGVELEKQRDEAYAKGLLDARRMYAQAWADGTNTEMEEVEFTLEFMRNELTSEGETARNAYISGLEDAHATMCSCLEGIRVRIEDEC